MLWLFSGIAVLYLLYALLIKDSTIDKLFNNRAVIFFPMAILAIVELILKWQYPDSALIRIEFKVLISISLILLLALATKTPFYGLKILFPVGAAANLLAITANGFCMPVNKTLAALRGITELTPKHCWADDGTNLVFLTDQISSILVVPGIASIGDILICLGVIVTAIQMFFVLRNERKKPVH